MHDTLFCREGAPGRDLATGRPKGKARGARSVPVQGTKCVSKRNSRDRCGGRCARRIVSATVSIWKFSFGNFSQQTGARPMRGDHHAYKSLKETAMDHGHLAPGARTRWTDGLTATHWRVLRASFLGWIFDGYEALVLVVVLGPMLHSVLTPAQAASPTIYAGFVIGITLLGWGIGGMVGGILADYVGRKRMMLWSVFLYAIFSGFTALSTSFWMLCTLRFITGLAMGSEWSTGIALLSETWPERARAKGAGFLQSGFGWGTMTAAVVWYALSAIHPLGAETWRLMFVLGAVPAFFVLYIRRGVSESEKWQRAVREKRWNATDATASASASAS